MDSTSPNIDETLRIRKFEVGDLVFAKLKGYPPWPSKINQIESFISGGKEKIRYNVYFYGTHQSSILRSTSLYHYDTYAKSIVEKWGPKPKFHDALKELEREMMDKITYLNQLRATSPDTPWYTGFSTVCDNLASDIGGANEKVKSKNHSKSQFKKNTPVEEVHDTEDDILDESRRLGYEVMYMERIPYPDTPESLIILSLNFNKEWVKEESRRIKEEERMKNCFVRIEPFPPKYAHLDESFGASASINVNQKVDEKVLDQGLKVQSQGAFTSRGKPVEAVQSTRTRLSTNVNTVKLMPAPGQNQSHLVRKKSRDVRDPSDSDEEAVETCPVCRLCFFSQADLKNHEKSVHGSVLTAESMFDRLMSGNESVLKKDKVSSWKESYHSDLSLM